MSRLLLSAAAATLLAAAPALGQPTLRVDKPCYAPGDTVVLTGEGWTPSGPIDVSFTGHSIAFNSLGADASGLLRAQLGFSEEVTEQLIREGSPRQRLTVAAVDQWAAQAGDGRTAGASATTLVSRFGVRLTNQDWDAIDPGRRLGLDVVGFTGDAGRKLHLHYMRGRKRFASVPIGAVSGPCGDVRKTLPRAFPFRRVAPGRWTFVFNFSRTDHRQPGLAADMRVAGG